MASLESLIYSRLTGDANLAGKLARYNGVPAVFELFAPPSSDSGWAGAQTPRIQYEIVRQEDPERRVDGELAVTVIDLSQSMAPAAEIEERVRQLLDGLTVRVDEGTVSLHWVESQPFDEADDFRGIEAAFDLIAWPAGLTYDPDPVRALRDWSAATCSDLQVDPDTWAPTDETPALYWRLASISDVEPQNWGAWVTATIHGHILAATPSGRLPWIRRVTEGLAQAREVALSDGSPLLFEGVSADSTADPLREGQIRLTARFGVLSPSADEQYDILRHAHMEVKRRG